ncbi:EcoRII N-terminal effector-binding domain-containing protein [Enterobacter hormaechei]|uniref:EcoRII N-terminal effector-binding domain-containing protein n=1 Tax=Enterobacter hormaechei TaxID=158836 RepID=UPI003B213832
MKRYLRPVWYCGEIKNKREAVVFHKYLSTNDTGVTGSKYSGVYFPPKIMKRVSSSICHTRDHNPCTTLIAKISSHPVGTLKISATYYNSKCFDGSI